MSTEAIGMSTEANKAIVRRFIERVFVAADPAAVDELVSDDFTPHSWPGVGPGREPLKAAQERVRAGLTDPTMTIDDVIAEDDRVAVRLTSSATQSGEFMGLPRSSKSYVISEIHIFRLRDGRIVEHWREADTMGMMRQLGALPEPATAAR
ncbi:MAG: ester cyclase [Candidatus Limnocylindrales bacterium]|jgi:steroid delta-isomerase-like uncharacterized protein